MNATCANCGNRIKDGETFAQFGNQAQHETCPRPDTRGEECAAIIRGLPNWPRATTNVELALEALSRGRTEPVRQIVIEHLRDALTALEPHNER